CQQGYSNPPTF
nr:immunoglobulin light chain junction region [Macaca mulatta]MOX08447.1 immunoglobulin light chain junction region [Macaca mulatta]MOX08810.1 immunoglobulin light chain junction region [Macaca mulatta]MOX09842.1 immunoglobulin light chain junction region [Macaca mulatta]MOX10587.1 immunoglobulin light chain junction region [Macaca mulatta]